MHELNARKICRLSFLERCGEKFKSEFNILTEIRSWNTASLFVKFQSDSIKIFFLQIKI